MPQTSICGGKKASHAGSWYADDESTLRQSITKWMADAEGTAAAGKEGENGSSKPLGARAIIAPHAGYSYCGHVMAHAYRNIDPSTVSRIFLLGPSHHFYSKRCLLSRSRVYETPLGPLMVDPDVVKELQETGQFDIMDLETEEAEHSMELHTPYIAAVMGGKNPEATLVPIMVGNISRDSEAAYGKILGPYLDDPSNLFIISSDFCHWGRRFRYTFYDEAQGPIWKSIQWLDHLAMEAIESGLPGPFAKVQDTYTNTICGQHPIAILLNMLQHCENKHTVKFVYYDQSSKCKTEADSSVSYASAVIRRLC